MANVYKTTRGAMIDVDALRLNNETTVAVGNQRVNARGDQLDEFGNVLVTRNQAMNSHYGVGQTKNVNRPRDIDAAASNSAAAERERARADTVDSENLQKTIAQLTKQLAEKDAQLANAAPVDKEVAIVDEIDSIMSGEFDAPNPEPTAPLRGGLASAIAKNQEAKKDKGV